MTLESDRVSPAQLEELLPLHLQSESEPESRYLSPSPDLISVGTDLEPEPEPEPELRVCVSVSPRSQSLDSLDSQLLRFDLLPSCVPCPSDEEPPFESESRQELCERVLRGSDPSLHESCSDLTVSQLSPQPILPGGSPIQPFSTPTPMFNPSPTCPELQQVSPILQTLLCLYPLPLHKCVV